MTELDMTQTLQITEQEVAAGSQTMADEREGDCVQNFWCPGVSNKWQKSGCGATAKEMAEEDDVMTENDKL